MLEDPETGRQLEIDTADPRIRDAFSSAAAAQRARIASEIGGSGASHLVVSTERDWLEDLLRYLERRRRRRR